MRQRQQRRSFTGRLFNRKDRGKIMGYATGMTTEIGTTYGSNFKMGRSWLLEYRCKEAHGDERVVTSEEGRNPATHAPPRRRCPICRKDMICVGYADLTYKRYYLTEAGKEWKHAPRNL